MFLKVNRMAFPVTALGPGRRLSLWVQGCTLRCEGCVSTDTWNEGEGVPVDAVGLAELASDLVIAEGLDGLTITGGEPLQQPEALKEFMEAFRGSCKFDIDILVFTGFEEEIVRADFSELASLVDAFVCGPYKHSLAIDDGLVASSNQTVYASSQFGAEFLVDYIRRAPRQMQASVHGPEIVFSGIPRSGDLASVEKGLLEKGVEIGGCSWAR